MAISKNIIKAIENSSWIRKMFEEGAKLKKQFGEENVFDFSIGNPDLPPPKKFYDTLKDLSENKDKGVHAYMPNSGFPKVKESIAEKVSKNHSITINAESIVMTCGAAGGLNVILKTILDNEDEIIIPKPYFVEYGFYIGNHNGKMILVDTNQDFSLNVDNIKNAITKKTKGIILTSPNNPTGKVYTKKEIKNLSEVLKNYNNGEIFLISDEPYREIVYDDIEVQSIFEFYPNSIFTTSYSKTLSIPGERIGYIAVNPNAPDFTTLLAGLNLSNRILGFVNAPALMQRIVANLNDVSVDIERYRKRKDIFTKGLSSIGYDFIEPEGAFYIFCKSPIPDDVKFVNHLRSFNILAVPGTGFGGPGYFRLSFCIDEKIIENSMLKFKAAFESIDDIK